MMTAGGDSRELSALYVPSMYLSMRAFDPQ
jgi:hypothetical protein